MALTKISRSLLNTGVSDSSDATAITIDSSENVGIGETSPDLKLHVKSSGQIAKLETTASTGDCILTFADAAANKAFVGFGSSSSEIFQISNIENGDMKFDTNNTERMRIDSSGNVGIGITNPSDYYSEQLVVNAEEGEGGITIKSATDTNAYLMFADGTSGSEAYRGYIMYGHSTDEMRFYASDYMNFYSNGSERMRLTSTGVVAIGKTSDDSTSAGVWIRKHSTGGHGQIMCAGTGSSAYEGLYVRDITNSEMEFMASYHGTVYYRTLSPLSDERKKDNIKDITFGLDAVKELRPVSFDWKNNKGNDQLGFIAQEVEATSLKQLVGTYNDENIEDLRTLNKEGLIPVLVKAIQELSAKVEELESKINE